MNRHDGIVEIFVLIGVFLLGGVLAWWMWNNNLYNIAGDRPTPTPAPTLPVDRQPTPQPKERVYTNTEFNYQLTYPAELQLVPAGYYPEQKDINKAPGVSIEYLVDGKDGPFFKMYVMDRENYKYQIYNANSAARFYLRENRESGMFIELLEDIKQIVFAGEEAYTFSMRSRGFESGWEASPGEEGVIGLIFFEHDGLYFTLAYYDQHPFNDIINTFRFTEIVCDEGEELQQCKNEPCCCPSGALCD